MPSASGKGPQVQQQSSTVDLLQDPLRNALQVFEKKQRNLEKRKVKLVETKKKADLGGELNEDQRNALENLALVENSLETVRELHKLVSSLELEYNKLVKKEQKRVKQEQRDQSDSKSRSVALKVIEIQGVLSVLTEDVRPDFLSGNNGACTLTEDELSYLDSIYELINPGDSESEEKKMSVRVKDAGQHLIDLVEGKEKDVIEGVTYKQILEIINKVVACGYFDKETPKEPEVEPELNEEQAELEETPKEEVSPVQTPVTQEEYPATEAFEEAATAETPVAEEPVPVNGVDLPPEVQQSPEDEKIDFLGESEINQGSAEQPSLNPVSPEFIPRNMQQDSDGWNENENNSSNWGQPSENSGSGDNSGWQSVSESNTQGQHGGNRDGYRGRGGRGGGGRGFGGRGRGRGGNFRGGRQDGGNYRGDGNYRGNRGGGNYRGNNRGGRGGPRGGPRGGGGQRGDRGGYNRSQQNQ